MRKTTLLLLVLIVTVGIHAQIPTQKEHDPAPPLTNQSVIEMSKNGIPAGVIISKIKNSVTTFDTTPDGLKILNEAGVVETVMSAMIEAGNPNPSTAVAKGLGVSLLAGNPNPSTAVSTPVSATVPSPSVTPEPSPSASPRPESPSFIPYTALSKPDRKYRLKSPASIAIAAQASEVTSLIARAFQSLGYFVQDESRQSLYLVREAKGFGVSLLAGMAGSDKVQHEIRVSVSEFQGISVVTVNLWVSMENQFGKKSMNSLDGKERDRIDVENILMAVKSSAERSPISK